jgi:hypothetical protein
MHSEDWCILLGLVFTVIMCICILVAYHQYKFDRHIWDAYPYFQLLVKGKKVSFSVTYRPPIVANLYTGLVVS